jgi:alkaline phosphatase
MTAGIKTYNDAVNVNPLGKQVPTAAQVLQKYGFGIGVVTIVGISHATPACAYAHNVHRDDYQDLTRDLLGLPSVAHPQQPLPGVDVLLGAGFGEMQEKEEGQGANFVAGNRYLTDDDLRKIDVAHGGAYNTVVRTAGTSGKEALQQAAQRAAAQGTRLFGFFGHPSGHLPYATADGKYDPTISARTRSQGAEAVPAEVYTADDLNENPTLPDLTAAALHVLPQRFERFWLMVEAGDVDWAAHQNNIDNAVGAVFSGDEAFRVVINWVERHQAWKDTAVIVTADHGHFLVLEQPQALIEPHE